MSSWTRMKTPRWKVRRYSEKHKHSTSAPQFSIYRDLYKTLIVFLPADPAQKCKMSCKCLLIERWTDLNAMMTIRIEIFLLNCSMDSFLHCES